MAKFCKKCGAPLAEEALFCANCGTRVEEEPASQPETVNPEPFSEPMTGPVVDPSDRTGAGASGQTGNTYRDAASEIFGSSTQPKPEGPGRNTAGITERNIALCILFTIITCGIYGLYWIYKLNDEINQLSDEQGAASGGTVILLSIVTCGIYGWYWCYKMGERVDKITGSDSNKLLFILLAVFQLPIVDWAIMQDTINKNLK